MCPQVTRQLALVGSADSQQRGALVAAFASSDSVSVDQHFGAALGYSVYAVDAQASRFLRVAEFARVAAGDEDTFGKLSGRLDWLADCDIVYCSAIGSSARAHLLQRGVHAIRVAEPTTIADLLASLREELAEHPAKWLQRLLQQRRSAGTSSTEDNTEESSH